MLHRHRLVAYTISPQTFHVRWVPDDPASANDFPDKIVEFGICADAHPVVNLDRVDIADNFLNSLSLEV